MSEKPISLEEYKEVGPEFFEKYFYVADNLGEGAKGEDVLKVMESLAALAYKRRTEEKKNSIGF